MKYKRHEETRITCLLHWHFPLSNIAGYYLAKESVAKTRLQITFLSDHLPLGCWLGIEGIELSCF